MILLDTTVLVYAVGEDHPLRRPARAIVADISAGKVRAHTTHEVIQEFAYVRARRRDREDATRLALAFVDLLGPLVPINTEHLSVGLEIWQSNPALGSFDAVLAAVALSIGCELVSSDQAFATVPVLVWRNLAEVA